MRLCRLGVGMLVAVLAVAPLRSTPLAAQSQPPSVAKDGDVDDDRLPKRASLRFLTEGDYPPFNYYDEEGILTGFNIDIARALCLEVQVSCDIQVRPWEALVPALGRAEADAVIASIAITPQSLAKLDFSDRYYYMAARFIGRVSTAKLDVTPEGLEGKQVAVVKGSAHEAFLKAFFRDCRITAFETATLAREAVKDGKVELAFDDGTSLAFWLEGTQSSKCCEFKGGAYVEPKYFGDGVAIAVRKGDRQLQRLLNTGLDRLRASGRYEELFLRYFPVKVY